MPIPARLPIIVDGIDHLAEHVRSLQESIQFLTDHENSRGARILQSVVAEEAAKILILVDLVRAGSRDQSVVRRQLGYFSSHVPRGIYVHATSINPGTFREVREYIEMFRPARYLDGPNDADWIFRNRIESEREEAFYVDYVQDEDGHRWVTPAHDSFASAWPSALMVKLVGSLHRLGLLTHAGLGLVGDEWSAHVVGDEFTWADNVARTQAIVSGAVEAGLVSPTATEADVRTVFDRWTFPLAGLDLSKRNVSDAELAAERSRIEEAFNRDLYGPFD